MTVVIVGGAGVSLLPALDRTTNDVPSSESYAQQVMRRRAFERWRLQIEKFGRVPKQFDCVHLARETEGFTRAKIESVFVEALFDAFENEGEPTDFTVTHRLTDFLPLSRLMGEQITALRTSAIGRAKFATAPVQKRRGRKMTA